MGLIRDVVGSAMGANNVSNGFNGPRMPFGKEPTARQQTTQSYPDDTVDYDRYTYQDDSRGRRLSHRRGHPRIVNQSRVVGGGRGVPGGCQRNRGLSYNPRDVRHYQDQYYDNNSFNDNYYCDSSVSGRHVDQYGDDYYSNAGNPPEYSRYESEVNEHFPLNTRSNARSGFRPLALPQITYGDGQPFVRGYSHELADYGIPEREFISILDKINVARIPNPEVQMFQKAASIAGWFVPGSASIGLMAGQVGVGVASAFGHASMVNKVLSKANLETFIPNGLEICIGKEPNLCTEVGIDGRQQITQFGTWPQDHMAAFGDLIAPLDVVLPPAQQGGRQDPLAKIGQALGNRGNDKKVQKAREDMAKGDFKDGNKVHQGLRWLIVRKVSPDANAHWQKTLDQSNVALEQEAQAQTQVQAGAQAQRRR